jgi:hypothetical protein
VPKKLDLGWNKLEDKVSVESFSENYEGEWPDGALISYMDSGYERWIDIGPGSETRRLVKDMIEPDLGKLVGRKVHRYLELYADIMGRDVGEVPERYLDSPRSRFVEIGEILSADRKAEQIVLSDGERDLRPARRAEVFHSDGWQRLGKKMDDEYLAIGIEAYILAKGLPLEETYSRLLETNNPSGI